jgi:hypothetical protein
MLSFIINSNYSRNYIPFHEFNRYSPITGFILSGYLHIVCIYQGFFGFSRFSVLGINWILGLFAIIGIIILGIILNYTRILPIISKLLSILLLKDLKMMLPDVILCNQYTLVTVSLEQEINIYIFRDELITTEYRSNAVLCPTT